MVSIESGETGLLNLKGAAIDGNDSWCKGEQIRIRRTSYAPIPRGPMTIAALDEQWLRTPCHFCLERKLISLILCCDVQRAHCVMEMHRGWSGQCDARGCNCSYLRWHIRRRGGHEKSTRM